MTRLITIFALLTSFSAWGSYRVYELKIEQYDAAGRVERIGIVLSTLDHLQYEHYYGGFGYMRVSLVDTWYCPGDTRNFRPYCPKPLVKTRAPSSFDRPPTRAAIPYGRQPVIP